MSRCGYTVLCPVISELGELGSLGVQVRHFDRFVGLELSGRPRNQGWRLKRAIDLALALPLAALAGPIVALLALTVRILDPGPAFYGQRRVGRDGKQGFALVHERRPDVVILDVEMPVVDGPEMAAQLFIHDLGFEKIPIVLCSGALDLPGTAALVGTPYFLAKPYTLEALTRLLDSALTERRPPAPRLGRVHA